MKMITYIIISVLFVIWFAFLGDTNIKLHPLSITIIHWKYSLAWIFAIISIILFREDAKGTGYDNGINDAIEIINTRLKSFNKEVVKVPEDGQELDSRSK